VGCARGEPARVMELPERVRLELESVEAGRTGDVGSCCAARGWWNPEDTSDAEREEIEGRAWAARVVGATGCGTKSRTTTTGVPEIVGLAGVPILPKAERGVGERGDRGERGEARRALKYSDKLVEFVGGLRVDLCGCDDCGRSARSSSSGNVISSFSLTPGIETD
jgi:hypothetical protein